MPPSAVATPAAALDALIAEYYRVWFRFHPETAVDLGVPGYAGLLRPYDDDDVGALAALHEKVLAGLEALDPAALDDPDRAIDARLLAGQALIEHHELLERDWRRRDPQRYLPVNAIHQLTILPVDDFAAAFAARVGQVPVYLRGARAHLLDMPELVPPVWLESALASAAAGADYLRGLDRHPRVLRHFPRGQIHEALERAARAVQDYGHFLEAEIGPRAQGEFACGREQFERLLARRHGLSIDADRLHAFGVRLFDQTRRELEAVARELRTDGDQQALWRQICAEHAEPAALLDDYRRQMRAARAFVAERDLVTLPARERLDVVETPPFLRHQIPFAAYMPPTPDDPEQQGYYYVTPPVDAAALSEHNHPGLMHTCVHEAWPGHHLQFVTANLSPAGRSLPRLVNTSATLYEGWALYCEQLMQEQGFLGRPEQRFILLRDRLWRALRVQLDVELQTRGLGVEAAADRMQNALGFPRAQALADLRWYTRSPAVPMGYAAGWALLNAARTRLVPAHMPLKNFHDGLLGAGSIGLPWVLRRVFGADLCRAAEADVFDEAKDMISATEPRGRR